MSNLLIESLEDLFTNTPSSYAAMDLIDETNIPEDKKIQQYAANLDDTHDKKNVDLVVKHMTVEEFLNKTLHKQLLMYTHQGVETLFIKRIMQETGEPKETALRQFEDMLKTKKLPLPWIDTVNKRCGNLYVALGIGEIFGYDVQIPVLVVTRFDWARYHESNRAFKFRNLMNRILTSVYANENDFWEQLESNIWTTFQYDFEAHGTTEFYLDTVDPNGNYEIIPDDDAKQLYIRIFDQEETIDYDELRICTPEEVDDYGYITPEAFRKYLKQPIKPRDGKDITNLNPYAED